MKKTFLLLTMAATILTACHENLEERAQREAREYTKKYCPTPYTNNTRTDSVTFDMATKTYHYYCTIMGPMDDVQVIRDHHKQLYDGLATALAENTAIKVYRDAGYRFAYTIRSAKQPSQVLFEEIFTTKK